MIEGVVSRVDRVENFSDFQGKLAAMTARVSMGAHQGDLLRRFIAEMMDVDAGGGGGGGDHPHQSTIHSGHFMVSCVHEDLDLDDQAGQEGDDEDEETTPRDGVLGYNFENASREPADSYQFGVRSTTQLSIDASLARLFNHMTLAYSGKITSPKWKNFKGIKVKLKDKIRLNNIIWREWHMQYIKRERPIICQFEVPISERTHAKPEAVVLEGKYWKRRLQCLTTEYKKWRLFYKNRISKAPKGGTRSAEEGDLHSLLGNYDRLGAQFPSIKLFDEQMTIDDDYFLSTFVNDTLFSSLNPPFAFPDTREIAQYGFGDIIQPNLIQLQPSLDESMDTLAPLPVLNEFRDFSRSLNEKNSSSKMPESNLIDFIFGDAQFPDETSQQESSSAKLALQSTLTPKDDYLIDQLQQQLMNASNLPPDSCLDLFISENSKPSLNPASNAVMTGHEDPFFSPGLCNDRLVDQKNQLRQALDQNSRTVILDVGLLDGATGRQMLPPREYVVSAGDVAAYPGGLRSALYRAQGGSGNALQTIAVVPDHVPSQGGTVLSMVPEIPWPLASSQSTVPLCVSMNRLNQMMSGSNQVMNSSNQVMNTSNQAMNSSNQAMNSSNQVMNSSNQVMNSSNRVMNTSNRTMNSSNQLMNSSNQVMNSSNQANVIRPTACQQFLKNDDACKTSRRGSTGSLPATKGKKHVTFLCPQPLSAPSSKPKQRHLAPAPAYCDGSPAKSPSGLQRDLSKGKAAPSADQKQQSKTILAQLLTQGKSSPGPFPSKATARSNWNVSDSVTPVSKEIPPNSAMLFPVSTVSPSSASMMHHVMPAQCQATSTPSSFSDFHKSMLSAAVSQALGVETLDAHEVTTSLFNNMLSRVASSASSSVSAATTSPAGLIRICSPSNNESMESTNDELDMQFSDNPRENRRVHHLSAEHKRRTNIKNGFETLNQLVPELSVISSGKINKATTLQKAAECCRRLKSERQTKVVELEALRRQVDELQADISACQAKLPATGVPVFKPQTNQSKVLFQDYVRNQTLSNWKFWIFSFLIRPLFDAYDESVVMTSTEAFSQTVLTWLQQHCSLIALRPAVLKALRELSTTTSILVDPSSMPQEATEAVSWNRHSSGQSSFRH